MTIQWLDESNSSVEWNREEQVYKLVDFVMNYVKCPYEVEVNVTLTNQETVHTLNRQYRNMDRTTDVLSFPMCEFEKPCDFESDMFESSISQSPETDELLLGDVILCEEKIKEQSIEYGHSELREFSFLVIHSLLHLVGYDHMEEEERRIMEKTQKDILSKLNINR